MDKRAIAGGLALFLICLLVHGITTFAGTTGSASEDSKGRDRERVFFEKMHYPYGASLPSDVLQGMWNEIQRMPSEKTSATAGSPTSWKCVGPFGADLNYTPTGLGRYMGRVTDVEPNPQVGMRFAAASGGLWGFSLIFPVPLSDQLTSLAIGSFDSKPGDPNTIIVGTGEGGNLLKGGGGAPAPLRAGTGAFKTTDGGATWKQLPTIGVPGVFYRVRYDPNVPNRVHAATDMGYMRSDDDGDHWINTTSGTCTDIAFASRGDTKLICMTKWSGGIFLSSNGGDSWAQVTAPALPTGNYGRGAVAAGAPEPATGNSPIYVSYGKFNAVDQLLGVFKSVDGGLNWSDVSPTSVAGVGQIEYNNVISVCPTDSRLVLVGWVSLFRSTDGGGKWEDTYNLHPNNHDNMHADFHALAWSADGSVAYAGNDGGISTSLDGGVTWTSPINYVPITQFYGIDVSATDHQVIFGGAQDNGTIGTTDGGATWFASLCCDAGFPSIDPTTTSRMYCVMNGARYRSGNVGQSWGVINNGLGLAGVLRTDAGSQTLPVHTTPLVYTSTAYNVQYSVDFGDHWTSLTPTPLPAGIADIEVPRENPTGAPALIAVMDELSPTTTLKLNWKGAWYEISTGFPPKPNGAQRVRKARMLTTNLYHTFAVMNGVYAPSNGNKVFASTDLGQHWNNITGNLPNIPLSDIVVDPSNEQNMFLGSEMGCYRTWDGGGTWYRWNDGTPQANIVTEMRPTFIDGQLWIVAGTYGRSIWMRQADTRDPEKLDEARKLLHRAIADNSHTIDSINATGPSPKGRVLKSRIRLDSLLHPFINDLVIVLRHLGVSDTLVNRLTPPVGGGGANFIGTTFDDDAPVDLGRASSPYSGTFRPLQPLSVFNGMDVDGPWILDVFDAQSGNTGTLEGWSLALDAQALTGVAPADVQVPGSFMLSQNYPNPFNPSTKIGYRVWGLGSGWVKLAVYDVLGREVAVLVNQQQEPGEYSVTWNAAGMASGVYLYRLTVGETVGAKRMVLLR